MNTLLVSLAAIAIIDSINPNAMAMQIYLLSTPSPVVRSITFILGDFTSAWVAGLLLAFGMFGVVAQIFNRLGDFIYVLQFILGFVLIVIGYNLNKFANQPTKAKRLKSLQPKHTFLLGATMAFAETPTALPYLAAIERITRANLELPQLIGAIAFYNIIFVFPLIVLLAIYCFFRNRASNVLRNIHQFVTNWFPKIMRVILIAVGFVLIVDCITHIFGYSIL